MKETILTLVMPIQLVGVEQYQHDLFNKKISFQGSFYFFLHLNIFAACPGVQCGSCVLWQLGGVEGVIPVIPRD